MCQLHAGMSMGGGGGTTPAASVLLGAQTVICRCDQYTDVRSSPSRPL